VSQREQRPSCWDQDLSLGRKGQRGQRGQRDQKDQRDLGDQLVLGDRKAQKDATTDNSIPQFIEHHQ